MWKNSKFFLSKNHKSLRFTYVDPMINMRFDSLRTLLQNIDLGMFLRLTFKGLSAILFLVLWLTL
jgi:hypothetical protein